MTERRTPKRLYLPMAHMLIDKLAKDNKLTPLDFRVVLWIAQQTYGTWKRTGPGKNDGVRPEYAERVTGYRVSRAIGADRRGVDRSISRLLERGILRRREDGAVGIDEHYEIGDGGPSKQGTVDPYGKEGTGDGGPLNRGRLTPATGDGGPLNRGRLTPKQVGNGKGERGLRDPSEKRKKEDRRKSAETRAKKTRENGPAEVPGFSLLGGTGSRTKDPWRRTGARRKRELQANASKIIDWLREKGFDAGKWWGRGLKLGRWGPAMVDALVQLSNRAIEDDWPENPHAYLETTYAEKEANLNADAAVDEARERQKEAGKERTDEGL